MKASVMRGKSVGAHACALQKSERGTDDLAAKFAGIRSQT
jgi:hypothetical protein